jgi:hypothetical protein
LQVQRTRRDIFSIALLVAGAAPLTAGCAGGSAGGPDGGIRRRQGARAGTLAALYGPTVQSGFAAFRGHHLAHESVLLSGGPNLAMSNSSVPAAPSPLPDQPRTAQLAPAGLAAAEQSSLAASATDLTVASGRLAAVLVNISACRALHCAALGATSGSADASEAAGAEPPIVTPTPGDLAAAQAILGAEHAAVYAYGALTPHLRGPQRNQADGLYELHRQLRDTLEAAIAAHGATPAAGMAAYAFPQPPDNPASAAALAGYVESRVAAVCGNAAAVTTAAGRPYASWAVTGACLRAYAWGRPITAFPAAIST